MSSAIVENIILTGEWVYDAEAFERAKKARLLPDDVWGLIKSYAIPPNKCACCNSVGERTFCLPCFHYSTRVWRLEDALLTKGLRDRREKLTYDDVVVEKNFESVRVCYACSGDKCRISRMGLFFEDDNVNIIDINARLNINNLFDFYIKKELKRKGVVSTAKERGVVIKQITKKYLGSPDKFSRLLDIFHSCWFDYVKEKKEDRKKWSGEGKVDRFNAEIDELIVYDNEIRIAEFYKEKYLKIIAKGFTDGRIDVKTFINYTMEYKITSLRSEEYHIERLTQLEAQLGKEYCEGAETLEEWKEGVKLIMECNKKPV